MRKLPVAGCGPLLLVSGTYLIPIISCLHSKQIQILLYILRILDKILTHQTYIKFLRHSDIVWVLLRWRPKKANFTLQVLYPLGSYRQGFALPPLSGHAYAKIKKNSFQCPIRAMDYKPI